MIPAVFKKKNAKGLKTAMAAKKAIKGKSKGGNPFAERMASLKMKGSFKKEKSSAYT